MADPILMADTSDPGSDAIEGEGLQAFAFYVGGDTPHVWTEAQITRQTLRYAVPIWVYGLQTGGPGGVADGQDCAAALRALGVPRGVTVYADMETSVDVPYLRGFRSSLDAAGYWYGTYGAASTVFGNPHGGGGWWVADWTGHPFEYPHAFVRITQYASAQQLGKPWDLSELADTRQCWDRRPADPPPWIDQAASLASKISVDASDIAAGGASMRDLLKAHGAA